MIPYAEAQRPPEWGEWTRGLIIINALVFGAMALAAGGPYEPAFRLGVFVPGAPTPWSWLTATFLHADAAHIIGNMWVLWIFGHRVEHALGRRFLPFYLLGGAAATALYWAANMDSMRGCVGASGAVSAVVGAYCVMFPRQRLKFFSFARGRSVTWTMSALLFAVLYLLREAIGGLSGEDDGIAHSAHLGGLGLGLAAGLLGPGRPSRAPVASDGPIAEALAAGQDERAAQLYLESLRRGEDPALEGPALLTLADRLIRLGHAGAARSLLDGALPSAEGSAAAGARLLLGHVHHAELKDLEAAARAYREAADHPEADEQIRAQAGERLDAVRRLLARTLVEPVAADEPCFVALESSRPPRPEQLDAAQVALAEAGLRLEGDGLLLERVEARRAVAAAEKLEALGLPVVVVPERLRRPLPALRAADRLEPLAQALVIDGRPTPWRRCVFAACYGLRVERFEKPEAGLLDIEVDAVDFRPVAGATNYARKAGRKGVVDLVLRDPDERVRWSPWAQTADGPRTELELLRRVAAGLVSHAPELAVNEGVHDAARGELADHLVFAEPDSGRYVLWQLQLARVRRTSAY